MVVVVMGVSGCGKTTVGKRLAAKLGGVFHDADDYHPPANVAKMAAGTPLNDEDRRPWLQQLGREIDGWLAAGAPAVLACSALKQAYRETLGSGRNGVAFVHLEGSPELIASRLANRRGHYMPPALLKSQFDTLEKPGDAISVSIEAQPDQVVAQILAQLPHG